MRHRRIASSKRHKKFKAVNAAEDDIVDERPVNLGTTSVWVRHSVHSALPLTYMAERCKLSVGPKPKWFLNLKNIDQQSVPRKWTQILEMKKQMEKKSKHKKKRNDLIRVTTDSDPIEKGMTRSDKPLPAVIEQGLYESEQHFLNRLSRLSAKARAEATIEDRFDVDFCQRVNTNEDIEDDLSNNQMKDNSEAKKKKSNKSLKQKLRRTKKKEKRRQTKGDNHFGHLSDPLVFGERVDEPPLLAQFRPKKLKIKH